jgi:glyceraldehyde-3-phosphate dehydrogenase/erythrose-4-phosphate dehydrogenase
MLTACKKTKNVKSKIRNKRIRKNRTHCFQETFNRDNVEVVAINDLLDVDHLAYLLKYDSVHGRFNGTVEVKDGKLFVNGRNIRVTAEKIPQTSNGMK